MDPFNNALECGTPSEDCSHFTLGQIKWTPLEGDVSSGLIRLLAWDRKNPSQDIDYPAYQQFEIIAQTQDLKRLLETNDMTTTKKVNYYGV